MTSRKRPSPNSVPKRKGAKAAPSAMKRPSQNSEPKPKRVKATPSAEVAAVEAPTHYAYRVLDYPKLNMRLEVGRVYTLVELEGRCGGSGETAKNLARRQALHAKLADPKLFKPESFDAALSSKDCSDRLDHKKQPNWVRPPVLDPIPGNDTVSRRRALKRQVASRMAVSLLAERSGACELVTEKDVLSVLRAWGFKENVDRPNVTPEGQEFVYSDTVGLQKARDGRLLVSSATVPFPAFTRILVQYLRDHWPKDLPSDFPFTSISVNAAYAAPRHRDKNNAGPSLLKCFGNFEGGQLRYWPDDPVRGLDVGLLKEEDAQVLDASSPEAVAFDGRKAHEVVPFTGERFSLVFFSSGRCNKAPAKTRASLESMGFRFPTTDSLQHAEVAVKMGVH